MKLDRYLFPATIIGTWVTFGYVSIWMAETLISDQGAIVMPNYQAGVFFFLLVIGIGILPRFHPRFGGLYPLYQRAYDFVLFAAFMNLPGIIIMPPSGLSDTAKSSFMLLGVGLMLVVFLAHFLLIPMLFRWKRYVLIHRILDLLQGLRPRNANLWIARGSVYYVQHDFEHTLDAANRAIDLTPPLKKKADEGYVTFKDYRLMNGHHLRMLAHFSLDQREMAFEDAEIMARLNPQEPFSYINRGTVSIYRDDFAAAEADLDRARQFDLDPLREAYLLSAWGYLAFAQHSDESQSLYQAALDLPLTAAQRRPLHPGIYGTLALLELRQGNIQAAEALCSKAHAIDPDYNVTAVALIHAQKGEWKQAVVQWRLIMVQVPRYRNIESLRHSFRQDPQFLALVEQIFKQLENVETTA